MHRDEAWTGGSTYVLTSWPATISVRVDRAEEEGKERDADKTRGRRLGFLDERRRACDDLWAAGAGQSVDRSRCSFLFKQQK